MNSELSKLIEILRAADDWQKAAPGRSTKLLADGYETEMHCSFERDALIHTWKYTCTRKYLQELSEPAQHFKDFLKAIPA
jgi:hypothetical protein